MSDSFVPFIVLWRTLQERHTARWAIVGGGWKMLIPSRAYCFCTPAVGLRAELEKTWSPSLITASVEVVPTADAHRTAIVHTLTVDVPFDQISLFELQRRRVMTRQGALVKRTRKKMKLGERRGVRSNLRTYVSYAPAILCVSDFCERERERERERDACDVIDIPLKSRVIMHMITSTARWPNASTRSEPVERSNFEVRVKTRSLALERSIEQQDRVIDERRWGSGSFAFAGQTAVDHPTAFRWHASSKKNRPSWCLFPFRMAMVLPLSTAWIADILSQASLRDVERQRCWKRGSGDFGTTLRHDWAIFSSMPLTGEVRRSPEPSARPSAAADSEERQICTTCLFAESVGLCLCFSHRARCTKTTLLGTW